MDSSLYKYVSFCSLSINTYPFLSLGRRRSRAARGAYQGAEGRADSAATST